MAATKKIPAENTPPTSKQRSSTGYTRTVAIGLGLAVVVATIGYVLLRSYGLSTPLLISDSTPTQTNTVSSGPSSEPSTPEIHLTHESVHLLLNTLDRATRRKDVEGVLQHFAPDAIITIHMKQGTQQQIATLTREEYRKTLAMEFAFPSANDFARVNTTVTLASDERSAKVSFKSTETLRQAQRELKIEGEATLVLKMRDAKPMVTSLEQVVPGDSN